MHCLKIVPFAILIGLPVFADSSVTLRVEPEKIDRRYLFARCELPATIENRFPCRFYERSTRKEYEFPTSPVGFESIAAEWMIEHLPAGESRYFVLEPTPQKHPLGPDRKNGVVMDDIGGVVTVSIHERVVASLQYGLMAKEYKRPFWHPVIAPGEVSVTRHFPMKQMPGEESDHPQHTSLFLAHGDVAGVNFWSEHAVQNISVTKPPYAHSGMAGGTIRVVNHWKKGDQVLLREKSEFLFLNVSPELIMDCTVTLTAETDTVVFGKTNEGGFAIRVAQGLTEKAGAVMTDSEGRRGEKEIWGKPAAWVDYSGMVEGKRIGVAVMNHPTSFRFPAPWHARGYGLFASNVFMHEAHMLKKGDCVTLKYRIYVHAGGSVEAKVADVYNGYAIPARATVEDGPGSSKGQAPNPK